MRSARRPQEVSSVGQNLERQLQMVGECGTTFDEEQPADPEPGRSGRGDSIVGLKCRALVTLRSADSRGECDTWMIDAVLDGETVEVVAAGEGLDPRALYRWLRDAGVILHRGRRRSIDTGAPIIRPLLFRRPRRASVMAIAWILRPACKSKWA